MRQIEKNAKTVEEAINLALTELELDISDVEVEIVQHPQKGFLGLIGTKDAIVKVTEKLNYEKKVKDFLDNVFNSMKLEPAINIETIDDNINVNLSGNDLGILIGRRGETLDSLQFLINLSINKTNEEYRKVVLDVEGYRKRREETLFNLAEKLANKVIKKGRKISLEPMTPHERRIIHLALQENKNVNTYSEGNEPYRKVVVVPKKS